MNAFGVNLPEKEQKRITPSMFSLPSANNNNIQTSAVAQPKQTQPKANWYSGSQPTVGETIAQIYNVGKDNPDVLSQLNDMFNAEIMNPESNLYQPYLMPTTDKVNDTNIRNTNNATNEWNQLQAELAYWANRTDRNYSDDEIINRIDMTKYPTLAKMDAYKTTGVTMDLLAPVGYSRDAMYGVLWSARNGGQTSGNYLVDAAQGIMGNGNKYQRDEALYGRRDATSDNYAPYTVGATALDDLSYKYGMQGDFTEEWLNGEGRVLLNGDEQSRKDYNRIYNTVMNTNKLDEQAAKFNADVEKAIAAGIDPDVFFKPETIEEYYPELAKALEGQRGGKLYETSRAVNFDYNKAVRDMKASYDKLHGTKSDEEFESEIATSTGGEFFGNEADQMTNQIKQLDTNVNLPDYVPIASRMEIDSMRLRASAAYSDVSSWVGNAVTNGTGGDLENKIALQTSAHDFANNNLFDAWDDFNYNSRTPQDFLGQEAKKFMEKYFPEQLAAGVLPTDEEFEAVRSVQDDPKAFLSGWIQVQQETIKALGEDVAVRKEAADAAQLRIDEIYDEFAEVYGEGTDQYNAAINTYKMAYEYKDGLPKVWSAFDEYQLYTQSEGVLPETFGTQLENSIGDVSRQILKVAGLIENAKVANMPQKVIANMESHLADLRNQKIVLDAHKLSNEEDYSNQVASFDKEYTLKFAQSLPESSHEEDVLSLIIDKTAYNYLYTDTTAPPEYLVDLIDAIDSMTEEERSNYKYLVVSKGLDEATAYFDALYENLTVRNAEEIEQRTREEANESFVGSAVSTAISPLLTMAEGQDALGAIVTLALGGDYNPYEFHASRVKGAMREGSKTNLMEWTDGWGEWAKENISPIAGLLYDGMTGIADSMLAKNFGKYGSAAVMALSGFNNALTDAAQRGAMDDSAFLYALSCAAIEGATEHFSFKRLTAAFKNGSNAVTKEQVEGFLKTVIKGFAGEGSEEFISGFGSTIADDVFLQSMSQYSTLVEQYREVAGLNDEEAARQATKDILSGLMYQFAAGGIGGVFGSSTEYGKGYALKKIGAISETPPTPGGDTPIGNAGAENAAVETEGDAAEQIAEQVVSDENQEVKPVESDEVQDTQEPAEQQPVESEQLTENQPVEEQTTEESPASEQGSGSNIERASAALATATKDGVSASQQAATVEGVLRSFGLDEMEASAAAKNIVSSDNIRAFRRVLSKTTNPEMVIKAIAMGSVVEDSESAAVFKSPITSKNAYDVSEQLISAYEADRINKHATSAYDANVAFSAEADATTDILKTHGKMDHTAEEEAASQVKEAETFAKNTLSAMNAAQSEFDNVTRAFNENPFDAALKERFQKAFDLLQKRTEEHLNAAGKLGDARRNADKVRESANEQRGVNIVAARENAKTQVAERVQQKLDAQENNGKKEAETAPVNENATPVNAENIVNEVPAVSEAEAAAKTSLDEAQQKFDEAKGKEVEAARNLGNAVAKYNENTSDPQAKAEMEAAMKALDSANAESVAAEESLNNAKAEYENVVQNTTKAPANQNVQQKTPDVPAVAQNPQNITPSAEQDVGNESGVVDKQGKPRIRYSRGTDSQSFSGTRNDGTVVNPIDSAKKLSKALGIGEFIGTRKMNGLPKAVLGYYNEYSKHLAVRSTEASSIRTTMHEVGHAISQKLNLTGTDFMVRNLPEAFKANYSQNLLPGEAFAEFVWRYMANDAQAEAFAGAGFVHQFEQSLRNAGIADAVHTARNEIRSFINADVNAKIGSTIVDRSETAPSDIKNILTAANAAILDSTSPLEIIDKDIRGRNNGKLSSDESIRDVALLRNTADKRAANLLTGKMTDSHWNVIGDSLATVIQKTGMKGKDFDLLNRYMLALHSMDRDAQGLAVFDSSISSDDRSRFISEVESNNPEVAKAAEAITNWWYNFMQTFMVDTGYLTQDTLDLFKSIYPHYVPTNRVKNNGVNGRTEGRNTFTVKRATGSTEKIYNPIDTIVQNVNRIVNMVSQNNVAVVFDNLYGKYEGLGIYARNVTQDVKKLTVNTTELKEKVKEILKDKFFDTDATEKILDLIGDEQTQWKQTGDVNLPNVLKVQRPDGGVAFYQFTDNEIYKAVSGLSEKNAHGFWDFFGRMTKGMAALTTGSNPLFSVRNFMRDFQKSVNYGTWAKTYADGLAKWMRSAYEVWREGGEYKQYKALGGGGWTRIDANTKKSTYQYRSDLFKGYNTSNVGRTAKWAGQKLWNTITLSRMNEIVEQTSRYAEYRFGSHDLSTEAGRQEAFLAAQEATVDFSRSGNSQVVRDLKQIIPFFNASVQGVYQTGREFFSEKERGRLPARFAKTVLNTAFASALASGLMLKFMDEEDKEEFFWLSDDLKSEHFYIPNPFGDNPPLIRIPLPQDALSRAVHGFVTNMMWNGENADESAIELVAIVNNIIDGFNPASSTIFDPLIAFSTNKNWYGSNIVPTRLENVSTVNQYTEETPEIFIALGQMLGVSPMKLQYAAEQYTGFLGQIAIPALSKDKYTGEIQGISAAFAEAKKKLTSDPLISNDVVNSFYDSLDVFTNIQYDAKRGKGQYWLNRSLSEQEAIAAVDEVNAMLKKGGILKDTQTMIAEMYDRIEEIEASLELTDHEKYVQTSAIRREMIENVLSANEEIAAFKEKYINGTNLFTRMFVPGKESRESTAYELLPETFRNDFENGSIYMMRSREVWDATGTDSALPKVNFSFDSDNVHYDVPEELQDEYAAEYKATYERIVAFIDGWDEMTNDERLKALKSAHTKAHNAAKKWYLNYLKENREW